MKQIEVSINRIRSAHDVIEFYPQSHHYNDIETGSSFIKDQKISWKTPCRVSQRYLRNVVGTITYSDRNILTTFCSRTFVHLTILKVHR